MYVKQFKTVELNMSILNRQYINMVIFFITMFSVKKKIVFVVLTQRCDFSTLFIIFVAPHANIRYTTKE